MARAVGYCQSMNYLAGTLMLFQTEEQVCRALAIAHIETGRAVGVLESVSDLRASNAVLLVPNNTAAQCCIMLL